jgi:hypothetical protein
LVLAFHRTCARLSAAVGGDDSEALQMPLFDPVGELMESLAWNGAPSHSWLSRWGARGGDPLTNAWHHAHDLIAMAQLIDLLHQGVLLGASPAEFVRLAASLPDPWNFADSDALRRAVPFAPTLPQLLHARQSLPPRTLDESQARWRASARPPAARYATG